MPKYEENFHQIPGRMQFWSLSICGSKIKNVFFLDIFFNFYDTIMILMICNTRNWSNDITKSQNEKKNTCFNSNFQYSQSKITGLHEMWSLKSLAMLKCERRTSLYAIQCK